MKKTGIVLLVAVGVLLNFSAVQIPDDNARAIVRKMLSSIEANKGCTYNMHSSERFVHETNMREEDMLNKVNIHPFKVYIKMTSGTNKGTEILYKDGENNNKAVVNPGKFLPDMSLGPFNHLLTKNEHHSLFSSGFGLVGDVIAQAIKRTDATGKLNAVFEYPGDVTINGRNCFKIVIADPIWGKTIYKAQKGETMFSIAKKMNIPAYFIMEWDEVTSFDEDLGGRTLTIPNSYAKKTVLYIDKENYFPIVQEMSDDKGVFERYEYTGLVVNPAFAANEFNKDFKGYGF